MKLTRIIFLLISALLMGSSVGCNPSPKKIMIKGRQIWVDDDPYFIKGHRRTYVDSQPGKL